MTATIGTAAGRIACLAFVLVVTGCSTPHSTAEATKGGDERAIRDTIQAYRDGREARDLQAVRAVLLPEVDQLTSRGEWRRGVNAATAGMKRSSARNPGSRTLTIEALRLLSDDVALVDARYVIANADGGDDRLLWSSFTLVRDSTGAWRIASIRNMAPAK